jgi:ABC-type amino acid transport substrate-binding protein
VKRLAAALLCTVAATAAAQECPAVVRVSFPNFPIPPLLHGSDHIATPPGQLVEWTRNALKNSGCKPALTFVRRPPNRQLAELAAGAIDILPGFSYSTELPAEMVFPMRDGDVNTAMRVVTDLTSLYVRSDNTEVRWDGVTLSGVRLRIGTSTGGSTQRALVRSRGWDIELAPTPYSDLQKLLAGRVDAILESDSILDSRLGAHPARKLLPPVFVTHRYAPVRKDFQRQYPAFTERFWLEMCKQSRPAYPALPACK